MILVGWYCLCRRCGGAVPVQKRTGTGHARAGVKKVHTSLTGAEAMSLHNAHTHRSPEAPPPKKGPWSYAGILAVLVVMALAFIGYLSPEMRVQWANFAALCGFCTNRGGRKTATQRHTSRHTYNRTQEPTRTHPLNKETEAKGIN